MEKNLKQWFVRPSSGVHFDVADGLRGLAILLVVWSHAIYVNPKGPAFLIQVGKWTGIGWLGVPVFFVLSGFLISLPFFKRREQDRSTWYMDGYATRRVLKIFPPFYLTIVVLAIYYYLRDGDASTFRLGLEWATGMAHFVNYHNEFNGSFWSLWVEIGFYVVLPLLFLATRGVSVRATGWIMFVILIVVPTVSRLLTRPDAPDLPTLTFSVRRFPNSLDTFAWGVLFGSYYVSMSREPGRWRHLAWLGYVGLVLLLIAGLVPAYSVGPTDAPGRLDMELQHLLPGISAFLLLFFIFDTNCSGSRFFASAAMRFVGIVSYEWFLIHQPALWAFRGWMTSAHGSLPRYLFIIVTPLCLTFALAVLIYHNFSLPILRWGRAKVTRATAPVHTVAS